MGASQTVFEMTGQWTPLEDETAFLEQIATETSAVLTEAGRTVQGRPIHRVDLGEGADQTLLIVCLQHANEQASREGALQQIRDLAYTTDPETLAYLAEHRIVWLTNVNADRFPTSRSNANGVNINRDHYKLSQPESEAIGRTISETGAQVIVDAHEFFSQNNLVNYMGRGGGLPGSYPAIQSLAESLNNHCQEAAIDHGLSASDYYWNATSRQFLSLAVAVYHAVGFVSETNANFDPPEVRVATQRMILGSVLEWHRVNAAACSMARDASRQHQVLTREDYLLARSEYLIDEDFVILKNLAGYRLLEPLPQKYVEVFDIQVDSTGFVPMNQPARLVIPILLDPESDDVQVSAIRVARMMPLEPMPTGSLAGARVLVQGKPRPIVQIRYRTEGSLHLIDL